MFDYLRIMLDARLAKLDERGASAVEYGLLIAGIAALIVVVVFAFGGVIKNIFQTTCNSGRRLGRRHLLTTARRRSAGRRVVALAALLAGDVLLDVLDVVAVAASPRRAGRSSSRPPRPAP